MSVNHEDGFNIQVLQQTDGTRHLQAFWEDQPLLDISNLAELLKMKPLWPIYQLRALTLVEERELAEHVAAADERDDDLLSALVLRRDAHCRRHPLHASACASHIFSFSARRASL